MILPWLTEFLHSAFTPDRRRSYRPQIDAFEERIVPAFDLQLYKAASAGMVAPGDFVTYNITLVKDGDEPVSLAVVQDTLPSGLEFISVSATHGSASFHAPSHQVTWSVNNLVDSGARETLSITVRATSPGVLTNTATVFAAGQSEFNTSNNVSTAVIQVTDPSPPPPSQPPPPAPPPEVIETIPRGVTMERFITVGPTRISRNRFRHRPTGRPAFRGVLITPPQMQFRNFGGVV